jgi:branched-chain amino acid transport system ATP-binding protein
MAPAHTVAGLPLLTATASTTPDATGTIAPLALHDVRAGYGRIEVLHGIDIEVERGAVTALLGPNGAGKTTVLNVMSGLLPPWDGCRHVQGRHVNNATAGELARIGICHIREGRSVFPNLSVADNLTVAASCGTSPERMREIAFALFPILEQRQRQLAGHLSGGEQQMLALVRGLGSDPAVLLVDELSMGLAPFIVAQLYERVADIAATGVSVLVVEQFATIGLQHASKVYVLAHGTVQYAGSAEDAAEAIQTAYLGNTSR